MGLYDLGIRAYGAAIKLAANWNPKAQMWVAGREGWLSQVKDLHFQIQPFWIHAASLGEYLQAKPIIQGLKEEYPNIPITLTFFSPSGYQNFKDQELVDVVLYLPLDTRVNARRFLDALQPRAAFFMKYEFWPNYMRQLVKRNIAFGFLSATITDKSFLFSPFGGWIRRLVKKAALITVQDQSSLVRLQKARFKNVSLSGDSRFDQVQELRAHPKKLEELKPFFEGQDSLIAGSCWPPEEDIIIPQISLFPQLKFVFAPHDVSETNISRLMNRLPSNVIRYSEVLTGKNPKDFQVLLVDTIGVLSSLYQFSTFAFVGGGFKNALHNILEPATFGNALFFGPQNHKYWEAKALVKAGGGAEISNVQDLTRYLNHFRQHLHKLDLMQTSSIDFVKENSGATQKTINLISGLHLGLMERQVKEV